MLCIEVELLAGRYAATAYNDRTRAEWPPHPARFFSALVAALYEHEPVDDQERAALLWLERQSPPAMVVDMTTVDDQLGRREVRDVFVPVNDITVAASVEPKLRVAEIAIDQARTAIAGKQREPATKTQTKELNKLNKELEKALSQHAQLQLSLKDTSSGSAVELKAARAILPDHRTRQIRTFPAVFPAATCFRFAWADDPSQTDRAALDRLCDRVTRLGHSSSLVRCLVVNGQVVPNLVPDPDGELVLRTVSPGQLARLEREYERHQSVSSRVLPARPQRYGQVAEQHERRAYPHSVFADDWIVFERVDSFRPARQRQKVYSSRPLSSRGTDLAQALRLALFEVHGARDLPTSLSGHAPDGTRAQTPHIAFAALPHVNYEHADGSVKGVAIILPRSLSPVDRDTLLSLIAEWERTRSLDSEQTIMELGAASLSPYFVRRTEYPALRALSPTTWCKPSTRFVTATPIALDRHPGNLRSNLAGTAHRASREAQQTIATACMRIGLPAPVAVEISSPALLPGAQAAHDFMPTRKPGQHLRARVHANICFPEPVRGPVILGAGRYLGLGLCLPVRE